MSVLIVTSLGDIVIDLHTDRCPLTTKNFLKLCKIKYFNGCLFHTVQKDFTAQTGDPTGKGTGGDSVYKFLYGDQARFFGDEIHPDLKHSKTGTVAMASAGENLNASQFYFTLRDDLDYLDGKHTVFGEVAEGIDTLMRINEAYVDDKGRPYKNIRIKHTYILDDPFEDPTQLTELIPERSPEGKPLDEMEEVRLEDDWVPMDETLGPAELEEALRLKEAQSNAVFLETVGDIPDAEIKPPENVLFVCKLNPVTQDEDLDTIFSRFGTVLSAEVIRDYKTGDSLCYAFIEFETNEACEQAYFKMDNALIDDRRIHVDFSQSVAKLWSQYRRGKGNQNSKGRGCFKCGGLDHIAKDCAESPTTKKQNPKYTLKDENTQRGGDARQSYDMVFDGDTLPSLDREDKKHRVHKSEDETKRWKRGNDQSSGDFRSKRDSTNDRDREGHDHINIGHREERSQGTRGSSRDDEHQGGRYSRERMSERRRNEENRKKRHDEDHPRRAKQDDRKRSNDHDVDPPRREDRDDKKRSKYSNDNNHGQGEQDDEKSRDQDGDRDSRQRRHVNSDIDRHRRDERYENKRSIGHSGNPHKREGGDRKRETEHHSSADRRDGQDDRKRTIDRDATSPDRKREYEKRR